MIFKILLMLHHLDYVGLVATVAIDINFQEGTLLHFFFAHAGRESTYMTLFDVGAAAFIFIIGISMGIAFQNRKRKFGIKKALFHMLIRFIALFAVGALIVIADGGFIQERDGLRVIRWDVVISIATTYLVAISFLFIKQPRLRFFVGIALLVIYQILLYSTVLRNYAIASNHGGIFGTLFGFVAICIMASAIGEYLYFDQTDEDRKYQIVLLIGIRLFLGSFLLAFIPGMEAAKRQVSLTYCGISSGITILLMSFFAYLDRKKNLELRYLRAFGMNPFLMYFLAEIPSFLIDEMIGLDLVLNDE
ncbi:hypothetical protein [Candidatus Harpocratesius sp.]